MFMSIIHFYIKKMSIGLPQHFHDDSAIVSDVAVISKYKQSSSAFFGFLIGFFTIVANLAGPIMVIYMLQLELPKMQMNGTRAWFFILVNCIKIPVQIYLGNLNINQIQLLIPLILIGIISTVISAEIIVPRIDQRRFEQISWGFVFIGAVKLVVWS